MSYSPRRPPRHGNLAIRGLKHHLTYWGEPNGTPLVLLHGWMDTGETWQFVVDCLPESWYCVAPDWRGFGDSDHSPDGYWFPDYLADLDALLDVLAPDSTARIAGHSMGGNIAALYAGVRPQRLAWFVNLEGLGLPRMRADDAPVRYEQWLDELRATPLQRYYKSVEQLSTLLRMRNPRLSEDTAAFVARAWSRPASNGGFELRADPRHRIINPVLYRREESEACWRRTEIPTLLLVGAVSEHRSRLGADATDEYFHSMYRHLQIATIPEAGHMVHHEQPQLVARHIVEFVRACEGKLDADR
jgi:pimeloyl-ACP methyl ester carboxylesterase